MPCATSVEQSRLARPIPAEPAPRNRYFSSFSFRALELGRIDHARQHDARCALYVVVIDAILVAVALEQVHASVTRPILKVDAALREYLLHRLDELVNKREKLLGRRAGLAQAQIQRVVQVTGRYWCPRRGTWGAGTAAAHRRRRCRAAACRWGCPRRWRRGHKAEDPAAVSDADEPNVFLRPVFSESPSPCRAA